MLDRLRRRLTGARGGPTPSEPGWQWPLRLEGTTPTGIHVVLRPLTPADGPVFQSVRRANAAWLEPWDATSPDPQSPGRTFAELVAQYDADARAGRALPFAVEVGGRLVGQLSVGSIVLGSFRSCYVGYWVSRAVAGQMVVPTALALAGDHVLGTLGLHRIEVNVRPENTASLAVVRKLGFRPEGRRPRYLHIAGEWRDHLSFALTTEDLAGETLMERLVRLTAEAAAREAQSSQQSLPRHTDGGPAPNGEARLPS
jgi:ribosomal-protein-alanine N-acetyltransferase